MPTTGSAAGRASGQAGGAADRHDRRLQLQYTSHGHCGKIVGNDVDNDATSSGWQRPRSHARAGADMVTST